MTIKHIVVWQLAAADEESKAVAIARITELLTGLIGQIDSIGSLTVGVNGAYPDKNCDIAVVADFADYDALEAYQVHPKHQAVAAEIRALVSGRAAIDYEY